MKKLLLTLSAALLFQLANAQQCSNCLMPFVSASQANGNSSIVTIPAPSGITAGDVMIAAVHSGWCLGSNVTAPAGWTLIANTANNGSGCGSNTTPQLTTFYKVATASEPSSYPFTGNTTQQFVGAIVAYSGVDTLNPINASSSNGTQDSCGAIRANSVTTTACTRLVGVFICSVNYSATNIVPQASLTERVDVGNTGNHPWGNENLEIADELNTTIGATGGRMAGLSGCNSDGWVTGAQMIALTCNLSLGMQENLLAEKISVMPNPSTGVFELQAPAGIMFSYEITDAFGRMVASGKTSDTRTAINLSDAAKGVYSVKCSTASTVFVKRVVIE